MMVETVSKFTCDNSDCEVSITSTNGNAFEFVFADKKGGNSVTIRANDMVAVFLNLGCHLRFRRNRKR